MKRAVILISLALAACLSLGAAPVDPQKLADADNVFAFKLLNQLVQDQPAKNIFISPYSAATVLQMAASGAGEPTKTEMQQVLGTTGLSDTTIGVDNHSIAHSLNTGNTNIILTTANAIWYRQSLAVNQNFLDQSRKLFGATLAALDFNDPHSADLINQWASDQTHGRINQIVEAPLDQAIEMFLANAVYFKGKWSDPFKVEETTDRPFHLRGGGEQNVPMMTKTKTFAYRRGTGYQAVRLPYEGNNLAMYVFLPDTNSSPEKLLSILNGDTWRRITRPGFVGKEGTVVLPRFKMEYTVTLNDPLEALGMKQAFNPWGDNFPGIAPKLHISDVLQKTFVEVKEEGTEAAAVTVVTMMKSASIEMPPPDPFYMIMDRPFLFLIEDRQTGAILFMGTVFNPAAN